VKDCLLPEERALLTGMASHFSQHPNRLNPWAVEEDLKFIHDGWQCVAELNATNNALVRSYVWGLDMSGTTTGAGGVGGLLMLNSATNGTHYYAYDGNGNVAGLVSADTGLQTATYEYEPFGKVIRETGPMAGENRYQHATKRKEGKTGLVLYEYRVFGLDGRFLSRDPLEEGDGPAVYPLVKNNPINAIDILGLWASGKLNSVEVHQNAIRTTLTTLTPADRDILVEWVKIADEPRYQTTDASYRHAMHAVTESRAESKRRANNFVRDTIIMARQFEKDCAHRRALQTLAFAMHCLQDNTSPMHYNFQDWDANYSYATIVQHVAGENYNPPAGHALYTATQDAWDYFTGRKVMPANFFP